MTYLDPRKVFSRLPEITGLPLTLHRNEYRGACYLDGSPSKRKDKTIAHIHKGAILILEQGGECLSLPSWLVTYGGASDWKHAFQIIEGDYRSTNWRKWTPPRPVKHYKPNYVPCETMRDSLSQTQNRHNNVFYHWLCGIHPTEQINAVFKAYNVATEGKNVATFWYVDKLGRICRDKNIRYTENGKRDRKAQYGIWSRFKVGDGYTGKCAFGSHLIDGSRPVACVESEKTALICALSLPQFQWVAVGGKSNIEVIDRSWLLYPDYDAVEAWEKLGNVVRWWEQYDGVSGNDDLGDVIIKMR